MKLKIHLLPVIIICLGCLNTAPAATSPRNRPIDPAVTDSTIRTVRFYTEGWEFSLPVMALGSKERVILQFDELSSEPKNYRYSVIQCDQDWQPSRMAINEYMEGFPENPLNDYAFSINTTVPYVNYRLTLPNEDVKIHLSGNYLLTIWKDGNRDRPVLVRPFFVTEKSAEIAGEVRRATYEGYRGTSQEISFSAGFPAIPITSPLSEIYTVVMQNKRWDNRLTDLKPTFVRQKELVYEEKGNLFSGGNEFRNFNAKNLQINGMGVKSVEYRDPFLHVFLEKDKSLNKEIYLSNRDLNGEYLVQNEKAADSNLESDYTVVHFSLMPTNGSTTDQIYVFGALSNWKCSQTNKMTFHPESGNYQAEILLKQGFYDYQYVVLNPDGATIDANWLEGSHVETENNYQIFVYYRGFGARYDRLIGYRMINSVVR